MTGPLLVLVGVALSTGLGYQPSGPAAAVTLTTQAVEARLDVDLTPKRDTRQGWNTGLEVRGRRGRVDAGLAGQAWSGGPWTKWSLGFVVGYRLDPNVRVFGEATMFESAWGGHSRAVGVEARVLGHVYGRVTIHHFHQATSRIGVSGQLAVTFP